MLESKAAVAIALTFVRETKLVIRGLYSIVSFIVTWMNSASNVMVSLSFS